MIGQKGNGGFCRKIFDGARWGRHGVYDWGKRKAILAWQAMACQGPQNSLIRLANTLADPGSLASAVDWQDIVRPPGLAQIGSVWAKSGTAFK